MNTFKLLIFFTFVTCIACSKQEETVQRQGLGKHINENQKQLVELSNKQALAFQKEETVTHSRQNPVAYFCDNKEKIDILFWPNGSTIDKAKFVVPRPDTLVEQGVNLNERKQFERNGEQITLTTDLNNDMYLDLITAGYCVGGGGCMYSIYINCGIKGFYHMHNFEPYALGIEVHDNSESNWKSIKVLSQDVDSSVLDEGRDVIYDFDKSSYQPVLN